MSNVIQVERDGEGLQMALLWLLEEALVRGRIATAADGRVPGHAGLWALGDCAAVPNGSTGGMCPPTAQFAVAQAQHMSANLLAHIRGEASKPFQYASRGMMATTGHLKGVAEIAGIQLSGLLAWLAWRAYYLMLMPTLGRKVRIFVEWTWAMFFPLDITHLRFTRTGDADAPLETKTPPASVAPTSVSPASISPNQL